MKQEKWLKWTGKINKVASFWSLELGFRASPLWIIITIAIIVIIYMIIFYLWIIAWKSVGHSAVSVAISVATCSLRLPIVSLSVGELN